MCKGSCYRELNNVCTRVAHYQCGAYVLEENGSCSMLGTTSYSRRDVTYSEEEVLHSITPTVVLVKAGMLFDDLIVGWERVIRV